MRKKESKTESKQYRASKTRAQLRQGASDTRKVTDLALRCGEHLLIDLAHIHIQQLWTEHCKHMLDLERRAHVNLRAIR